MPFPRRAWESGPEIYANARACTNAAAQVRSECDAVVGAVTGRAEERDTGGRDAAATVGCALAGAGDAARISRVRFACLGSRTAPSALFLLAHEVAVVFHRRYHYHGTILSLCGCAAVSSSRYAARARTRKFRVSRAQMNTRCAGEFSFAINAFVGTASDNRRRPSQALRVPPLNSRVGDVLFGRRICDLVSAVLAQTQGTQSLQLSASHLCLCPPCQLAEISRALSFSAGSPCFLLNEQYIVKPPYAGQRTEFPWHRDSAWCDDGTVRTNERVHLTRPERRGVAPLHPA